MTRPSQRPRRRFGFTLVELLVVVVIISILIALLVPVIAGAVKNAKDAAVTADINALAQGMEAFKNKYGQYPPSRIILFESGAYVTSGGPTALSSVTWFGRGSAAYSPNDLSAEQLSQRSLRYLRNFFPQAQALGPGWGNLLPSPGGSNGTWFDFNGNGVYDANPILLEGHECLVFFLGGITNHSGSVLGMDGFGKNPSNPFINSTAATNRNNTFFEFRGERLIDDDGNGIPGYVDSLATGQDARYLVYFSAYGQNGYDPNDVNFIEADPNDSTGSNAAVYRGFRVNFGVNNPLFTNTATVGSYAPNPYTSSDALPPTGGAPAFQNPTSFQIISAGRDRNYGIGGQYLPNSNGDKLPFPEPVAGSSTGGVPSNWVGSPPSKFPQENLNGGYRVVEQENLTNFSTSRLQ
jgi:prepilin-type N-terminal cleavage/methylation domain-containing protein